jgi:hypothetical protein
MRVHYTAPRVGARNTAEILPPPGHAGEVPPEDPRGAPAFIYMRAAERLIFNCK